MQKALGDIALGAVLLAVSVLLCMLAGEPGGAVDTTPLFITVPMALYQIGMAAWKVFHPRKEKRKMAEVFEIRSVRGHYEAYVGGRFICSGDTHLECEEAAEEYLSYGAA